MKHPLTSKERRGLVAVAAAALLCIASGFIFRSCASGRGRAAVAPVVVIDDDSVAGGASWDAVSEKPNKRKNSKDANGKRSRRTKRISDKTYPSRSPLDEPIGQ